MLTLEEEVKNCLASRFKNIKEYQHELVCDSDTTQSYVSDVHFLKFINPGNASESIQLVAKIKKARHCSNQVVDEFFDREITVYTEIYPKFKQFEKEKSHGHRLTSLPECFGYKNTDSRKILLLENIREKGYSVWPQQKPMTMEHIRLVLQEFSKFHAVSFAMRNQDPKGFAKLARYRNDIWGKFLASIGVADTFKTIYIDALKYLDGHISKESLEWCSGLVDNYLDILLCENVESGDLEKYGAICHMDGWNNNFMFKYEALDDGMKQEVTDVCVIDWQCSTLSIPAFDLAAFLLTCSGKDQFPNLKNLLDFYYEQFAIFLRQLGSDPEELYPYQIFHQHWLKYSLRGFLTAPGMIFTTALDDTTDLKEYHERILSLASSYLEMKFSLKS